MPVECKVKEHVEDRLGAARSTYHAIARCHLLHQIGILVGELLVDLLRFFIFRRISKFHHQWRGTTLEPSMQIKEACPWKGLPPLSGIDALT